MVEKPQVSTTPATNTMPTHLEPQRDPPPSIQGVLDVGDPVALQHGQDSRDGFSRKPTLGMLSSWLNVTLLLCLYLWHESRRDRDDVICGVEQTRCAGLRDHSCRSKTGARNPSRSGPWMDPRCRRCRSPRRGPREPCNEVLADGRRGALDLLEHCLGFLQYVEASSTARCIFLVVRRGSSPRRGSPTHRLA